MRFSKQIKRGRFSILAAISACVIIFSLSRLHMFGLTSNMANKIAGVTLTPRIYGKICNALSTDIQFINDINEQFSNLDQHPIFDGIGLGGESAGAMVLLKNGSKVSVRCVIDFDSALVGVSVMDLRMPDIFLLENRSVRISMSSNLLDLVREAYESNGVKVRGVAPRLVPREDGQGWRFQE